MARRWPAAWAMITVLVTALMALSAQPAQAEPAGRVVVVGVPGLQWSDLSAEGTPALWRLTGEGAAAALSVRTTTTRTCPVDGWLTVSAGQRARLANGSCALPTPPQTAEGGATVPGWSEIVADNADTSYGAKAGLLGDAVRRAGGCTQAVGPGGAFAAADSQGRVDRYAAGENEVTDWAACALTVVDIDDVSRAYVKAGVDSSGAQAPVSARERARAASAADARIARVVGAQPAGTTVLVAGLADTTGVPHLHVALASGGFERGYLTSAATRRDGLVTLTDLTATALDRLGIERPADVVGSVWKPVPSGDTAAAKAETLHDQDLAAQAVRKLSSGFFVVLFTVQLLLYGYAAIALRRSGARDRRRILGWTRIGALAGAATPAAAYLAGTLPWWRASSPGVMLVVCVAGLVALITALALAGPWRRSITGPGLVIAGLTAAVLGLDVVTGSSLQINTFMGYTALVAGRFYGFGNMAFALFATASILTAAWLAEPLLRAGRRLAAVAVVTAIGLTAMVVDGLPGWGSDFGGVIAILVGTGTLALLISGRRVSVVRMGLLGLLGAAVVLGMSFADSRRAEPTHLGQFWRQLAAGEGWSVVTRKFGAMLNSLGHLEYTLAVIGGLLFLFLVLARPSSWRTPILASAYRRTPTLRPALLSVLVVALIGMLMNDSGVVIPALVFTLAIPLVLAACVRALELDAADAGSTTPEEPAPSPARTA
ncbi:hypothetical protein [Actinocorallia populi]|uniref:hypothetical protein n=1 Tax=Actinocorallia populi TaxID=2079200 RepID=UPI0013007E30|nr:hypothetical protein [Actinocorallia populi]